MLPRLARLALYAVFIAGMFAARASSQPPATPAPQLLEDAGPGLAPLWDTGGARPTGHRTRATAVAPLAPFVTASLAEDAAWEGFVTPASRAGSALFVEYHGKLVMENTGIASRVISPYLSTWDGTKFEALPALDGYLGALGVWNDHLIAATYAYNPQRFAILQLEGAVWDTLGKPNNFVWKFSEFQGHLIAGGRFTAVSGVASSLVAAFDGVSWSNAGTGISGNEVTGLTVHVDKLVAGGASTPAQGVASLDALGGAWQPVGTGFGAGVKDVLSDGVDLYASGRIWNSTVTTPLGALMRWNGATWSSTGSPTNYGTSDVRMTRWNGKIVANMPASTVPGSVGRLSQWDGVSLTSIPGESLSSGAAYIGTWGTKLVATGSYGANGSTAVAGAVIYDGVQWGSIQEAWGPGMSGPTIGIITDMRAWGGKLIVSGQFPVVADQDHWARYPGVAAWDGTHWSPLGGGLSGQLIWLGEYAGDLIAAGYTMSVRGLPITKVARWDGASWSALGTGAPDYATAIAEFQGQLCVSSDFLSAGLWHWNGSTWSGVPGLDGESVETIAVAGTRLVVGGSFTQGGAIGSPNVVFWDGSNLQPAGAGVNNAVNAAAGWLGQPVIGGPFTASGSTPLPGVAIWDGSQWQPMGTRAVEVYCLRVLDGELFATGKFRLPDDTVAETIAHWTGTDWHVLGSGSNDISFASYGGYLYQAGYGLVHGHPSHDLSRVPLSAVLDVPRPQGSGARIALSVSPNPARGLAGISFTLPAAGHARVTVLDLAGRHVATLADGAFEAGPHRMAWTTPGAPGVYMALLETGGGRVSRRFVVLER